MRKLLSLGMLALAGCCFWGEGENGAVSAVSPDGRNEIRLWTNPLAYEVRRGGTVVVAKSEIGMKVDGKCLNCGGEDAPAPIVERHAVAGTVETPIYKKARIDLSGNEAFADFGDWGVRLAARNDGVAYRFETKMPGQIKVNCEKATVNVPDATARSCVYRTDCFGCEETVPRVGQIGDISNEGKGNGMVYLPLTYTLADDTTVAVTDADVRDYPVWYLKRDAGTKNVRLESVFAAKSMNRSYVFVLQPPFGAVGGWLSKLFHQSHATLPGFTQEKSRFARGAESACTRSDSQRSFGASPRTNARHGKARVPSVSTR